MNTQIKQGLNMISTRKEFSGHYPNGYTYVNPTGIGDLATRVSKSIWSNILWAGGHRREENYLCSYYAVFDYDDGITIVEATEMFKEYSFILGTTKSHQKDKGKGKPACDRFRVVVPWVKPISKIDVYRYNAQRSIEHFKSDPVAYDGARLWQPCHSIVTVQDVGRSMPVKFEIPSEARQENLNNKFELVKQYYEDSNSIPAYARDFLEGIYSVGEVNTVLFKTCVSLFNRDMSEGAVMALLQGLPQLKGHGDLTSTVRSARRVSQR